MKRALYTIADEEFATLLERTHNAFEKAGIPYMFVGGVAIQAHVSNCLCKNGKTLLELAESPDCRIQDHLRATDDIDIVLNPKNGHEKTEQEKIEFGNKIYSVLDDIAGKEGNSNALMSPSENHLVAIVLERKGLSRPIFRLGLDNNPDPTKTVSFNLYKGPEDSNDKWSNGIAEFERNFYDTFINRAMTLNIPYSRNKSLIIKVKTPEDLMATKIVRGRDKDFMDILSLAKHSENAGMPVNYEAIREILCKEDPKYKVPNLVFSEKYEKAMEFIKTWKESQSPQPNKQ